MLIKNNHSFKKTIGQSIAIFAMLLVCLPGWTDDTEIYEDYAECSIIETEKYRFIFIVDNSGSMSSWEFTQSRNTINSTISEVLNSDLDDIEVAVVQYGTNHSSKEHKYDVSVPFTANEDVATDWNRHYGPGSDRYWDLQDHQPASLSKMRLDNVYASGEALDVTDATNVQFVFFTDALRDYPYGCCSSLVSEDGGRHGDLSNVLPGFGEYDALKSGSVLPNGLRAQFTILHVPPGGSWGVEASKAAAAIASPGGNFIGTVEYNSGDPEGPGTLPRRYVQGNFSVNDSSQIIELIRQVIEEVKDTTYTNVAPAVSVNAFNELQHRNELYFSVFNPGSRPRWGGNVKKFTIDSTGVILDANQKPAIDEATGSVLETAESYWSDMVDGANVAQGGYRGGLTNDQTIYTDSTALEDDTESDDLFKIESTSKISLDILDLAENDSSGQCVLIGDKVNDTLTVPLSEVVAESEVEVEAGQLKLKFTTTSSVEARLSLAPSVSSRPSRNECQAIYAGGEEVHECIVDIGTDIKHVDLLFTGQSVESEVEYIIEYNIPSQGTATVCSSAEQQREDYLTWLRGVDIYNKDGDDSFTDAHQFAADPLHSKPFVITYSGTNVENAKEVLFVTDNLGMLHAIDPANNKGTKIWSYMPEEHLDNLKKIILNKAGQPKVYGLDGPISAVQREANGSSRDNYQMREVMLYLGERRGGRNYYAIDVSNASASNNNMPTVKWKIKGGESDQFEDLGQTWSRLLPRKLSYNCNQFGAQCDYMEVMVFSGGYDPAYDTPDDMPKGTLGNAIYIVDLETGGEKFFWSAGNNSDVRTKHRHTLDLDIEHSIAATPTTIDTNGDGAIDMIYAVDINGGVWRIDLDGELSMGSSGSGGISKLSAMGGNIADLSGEAGLQRFYNALDISRTNPDAGLNQFVIAAGTGYRAHPNDMEDTNNKLFVVLDPNTAPFRGESEDKQNQYRYVEGDRIIETTDLVEATASDFQDSGQYGYFLSATADGEKFLQPSLTINNTLIISSFVPGENNNESCSLGSGRSYFLDSQTLQSRFNKPYAELTLPGIPPETSILRLPKVTICIGTNCASAVTQSASSSASGEEPDCDASNFTGEGFGGEFAAAVSSAICGLETGRAYRQNWYERRSTTALISED